RGGFESTPSMSRTQRLPRPEIKAEPRGAARQEVQKFLQTRRREVKTPQVSQDQQAVKKALPMQVERNRQAAANVNTRIKKYRPNYGNTFNDNFFERHHHYPGYYHRGVDWWRPYPWVVINNFLGFGWAYPVYFDVAGYPVQIAPDVGYVPEAGYPEAEYAPAEAAGDWLSLGVFVAARSEDDAAYSPMFVQLAINKEGDLAGTYYNAARDQIYPLDGLVDRESQQAVWKMSDDPDSPIMTTGLFNLTQDVAPIQVHFSDGSDQSWVLVRLSR
ncbi:MAG: hypothetical protein LLG04_04515, partial [Parachlamydia sp.]|nr:hypothetical protein [Parachlamydia sp.]